MMRRLNVIYQAGASVVFLFLLMAISTSAQSSIQRQVDSLFVIASSGEVRYRDMVEPAKDAIAALGAPAVPYLIDKFTTKSARERWTVIFILQKIGSPAVPDLVNALGRTDGLVVQRVCWALGDIGDTSSVEPLMEVSNHPRWQVRDQAVRALGKIGDIRGAPVIMSAFTDTIGQVRKAATVSAGQLKLAKSVEKLVHMLGDDFYGARMSAIGSLLELDTAVVVDVLADSLGSENSFIGNLGCHVLGNIGSDEAMELLMVEVRSDDPNRRAHAAVSLVRADPLDNCGYRKRYLSGETDRLVRMKIESAIHSMKHEQQQP